MHTFFATGPRDDFLRLPCESSASSRMVVAQAHSPSCLCRPMLERAQCSDSAVAKHKCGPSNDEPRLDPSCGWRCECSSSPA